MVDSHSDNPSARRAIRLVHLQLLSMISGVQKVTLDEFEALDRSVFEPALICKEEGALTKALGDLNIDVHYAPGLVRPISLSRDLAAGRQLFRLLRAISPDIIHTHSSKTGILGRIAGRLSGVPVVIHMVHGYAFPFTTSKMVKLMYFLMEYIGGKFADVIVVLTEADRRMAIEKLRIPERKVMLIPNGIDTQGYSKSTGDQRASIRREQFGIVADDVLCVGMVGRLWEQKNAACLVRAAKRVIEKSDKPVRFYLIGDGKLRNELEQYIAQHKLGAQVHLLGWREDVPALLSAMDLFVLPSLWEGMPLAILEAMASGLAVVASDISGNNDLVTHDETGMLFDADDDGQLADAVLTLQAMPERRKQMGELGRQRVIDNYQLHNRNLRISQLYLSLLADKRPNAAFLADER